MVGRETPSFLRVAPLDELRTKGVMVIATGDRPIAVFHQAGELFAIDNRCPHLGFPLHRGVVADGMVTCHWHEARFELCGGCTFDLWADDVPSYETSVRDGVVFVAAAPKHAQDADYFFQRLDHGMQHNIALIQAKAFLGLRSVGEPLEGVVRRLALFGADRHDSWGQGMTLLTLVGNLARYVSQDTMYHALIRASSQLADDCSQAVPHRNCGRLTDGEHPVEQLRRWMRLWVTTRHRDAAERVTLTAIERLGNSPEFADILFTAASDRVYSQTGHVFDAANKSLELLDLIGWEHASRIVPLTLASMTSARGAEESAHWHYPMEIIAPLRDLEGKLEKLLERDADPSWKPQEGFVDELLSDNPLSILDAIEGALLARAAPVKLIQWIAYAAALRLARFATTNEVADWFNPRHTFIFCNAVHKALLRSSSPTVARGLLHAALSVYMDRFLNVPAARIPTNSEIAEFPKDKTELRHRLIACFDRHANIQEAAMLIARYLRLKHPVAELIDALAFITVREDLDFHALQVLEAGVRQYELWNGGTEGEHILIGVGRQLAAICPTPRAGYQTATIARRLHRGEKIYED